MACDIRSYDDFRTFLRETYQDEKASSEGVTMERFARLLGMSSSSFRMVTDGSRRLTTHNVFRVAQGLRLDNTSHQIFETLVLRDQAECEEERAYYANKLEILKANIPQVAATRIAANQLVSRWYLPALLVYLIDIEKVGLRGTFEHVDIEALAARFHVTRQDIELAIARFEDLGLLKAKTDEKIHLIFEKVTNSFPKRQYLKNIFSEGMRRLDECFDSKNAILRANTFSLPRKEIANLRADFDRMIERYMALASDQDDLEVIQVNCQIFPII